MQAKMLRKIFIIIAFSISVSENALGISFPLHASCHITWRWPTTTCADIEEAVTKQIGAWTSDNCGTGQKCLYKLKGTPTDTKFEATHTTPVKHYVDDLEFTLAAMQGGCEVKGFSSSETWYAVLDYGTNYCNLHNLITGAKLDKLQGYTENTNNSYCTQYTSADCEKY